jgi:Peptidase family M23
MFELAVLSVLLAGQPASAGVPGERAPIQQVELAPVFYKPFACIDHPEGQLSDPGDALGTDCLIVGGLRGLRSGLIRFFDNDGSRNQDWFSWNAEVHAPFAAVVKDIGVNPVINGPGAPGNPPASYIAMQRDDGVVVVYAHIQNVRVKIGDRVTAGEVVALDGDNGTAKAPHVHVGAYRGQTPLQIRWNLRAEGQVPSLLGN